MLLSVLLVHYFQSQCDDKQSKFIEIRHNKQYSISQSSWHLISRPYIYFFYYDDDDYHDSQNLISEKVWTPST